MAKTLILIDGHALAFRMFFALERTNMQTTSHEPTWAVYGFFKAIFDLLKNTEIDPNAIAVAFDVSKHTFRVEKYEQYKANRLSMPDSMRPQLRLIEEGLKALKIPIYTKEGFEADDIIGTISKEANEKGWQTYILTGDKDSFQLVDKVGRTKVLIPSKGELVYYDWNKVVENLGVTPEQVIDYKALCGDKSDNIPGVLGIGAKTACKLLEEYKTLDNIYKNIDNIKQKSVKEKLTQDKETAYLSYFLATIKKDVEINFDFESACLEVPNKEEAENFFKKVQIFSIVKNMDNILKLFAKDLEKICQNQENIVKFKEIQERQQSLQLGLIASEKVEKENDMQKKEPQEMLNEIKNGDYISVFLKDESVFIGYSKYVAEFDEDEIKSVLEDETIKKIVFDTKNIIENLPYIKAIEWDVILASYVKDSSRKHDLISQIANYLNEVLEDVTGFEGAYYILKLFEFYKNNLDEDEKKILKDIELPLSFVLKDMEDTGVSLDVDYLKKLSKELEESIRQKEDLIYQTAGTTFNINSPKQVGDVLFNTMKIKPKKKNKLSGNYSTSAKVLEDLAQEFEIARDILDYRQLAKLKGTYVDALPKLLGQDNKIHTHFNQVTTTTGRLSSSDPNLQNIPIRTEIGNSIRGAFVPKDRDNFLILSADYSQIELRLLAHFSEDETLIEAFKSDEDIHSITASKIFGVDLKSVTKDMRRKAKGVNFGLIYGQTRYGLSSSLGIPPEEAQIFINKYFRTYPKISNYINATLMQAHEKGFVSTLFGRKRYLKDELNSRNATIREFAGRAAVNAPLQGTAADLIKIAMIDLHKKLKPLKSKMIMQVHDELILEVFKDELEEVKENVKEAMELGQPLKVPLKVDIATGKNWKEGK